jgi:hypothetical protein
MLNKKSELIQDLISRGQTGELLALMEGESAYTTEASTGVPDDSDLARIWMGALYHLRFIARFGSDATTGLRDGRVESPVPDEFAKWLKAGAPGIGESDLENFARDHPFLSLPT